MMIKNIIFDLGNVLLDYKPDKFLLEKYSDTALRERLHKVAFQCPEWIMFDKGVISQEEVVQRLSLRYPNDANEIENIFRSWTEMLRPISGTIAILKKLKELDYRLYVLSNYHIKAFNKVFEENDFFRYFDGMVISAKEKTIKPEAEIYQLLINKYKIMPEESIFIDDTEENLKGAEKFGIKTILFTSSIELSHKLKEFKIKL